MFPMGLLSEGERAEVVKIPEIAVPGGTSVPDHMHRPGCRGCGCGERDGAPGRIEDMGLRPGKEVEMLNNGGSGALLVKVDDSRIAVGRGMAMKIMVRRQGR